jgi:hypothetical protein
MPTSEGNTHGSRTLLAEIERTRPAVTISGHVHAARGRYTFSWGGHVYNVAAVDEFRQPHSDAVVRIALPSTSHPGRRRRRARP